MIPIFKVYMDEKVGELLRPVLHSGYIGEGAQVKFFTERCSQAIGNSRAVATNSCTAALELALRLCGVGPGTTVISTPMTCLATNTSILGLGASILWADVELTTGCIDPRSVKELLEKNRAVKAVMCVHWGGYPCNMGRLWDVANDFNIPVIEDAAHAWMSSFFGEPVGFASNFACFSFQAIKHLTTGDGGLLALSSEEDYEKAKLMKWFGLNRDLSPDMRCIQDPPVLGFKMHMNDIAAAIGLANFDAASENVKRAKINACFYNERIGKLSSVLLPKYVPERSSSYWLYPLLVDDQKSFVNYMREAGIACSKVHERNDIKTLFRRFGKHLPGVDYFDTHQVNIPVGWWVSDDEREQIVNAIRSYDGNTNHTASRIKSLQEMY